MKLYEKLIICILIGTASLECGVFAEDIGNCFNLKSVANYAGEQSSPYRTSIKQQAYKNLTHYCCNYDKIKLIDCANTENQTNALCTFNQNNSHVCDGVSFDTTIPKSSLYFDHLVDVGFRTLDCDNVKVYDINSDELGCKRRNYVRKFLSTNQNAEILLKEFKKVEYWGERGVDGDLYKKYRAILIESNKAADAVESYLSNKTINPQLYSKITNYLLDSRYKKEIYFMKQIAIEATNKQQIGAVAEYSKNYFLNQRLSKLYDKFISLVGMMSSMYNKLQGTKDCNK